MIVTVQRTGGFAGLTRTWQVDVEAEPDTDAWLVLLDHVPWSAEGSSAIGVQPDRFVYVISADTRPRRRARLPESRVTGPWRELVDRVQQAATTETPRPEGR
jgi:hypothetical protein